MDGNKKLEHIQLPEKKKKVKSNLKSTFASYVRSSSARTWNGIVMF